MVDRLVEYVTPEDRLQKLGRQLGQLDDLINKGAYKAITDGAFALVKDMEPDYLILSKILAVQVARGRSQAVLTNYLDVRKRVGLSLEAKSNCLSDKLRWNIGNLDSVEEKLIESLSKE